MNETSAIKKLRDLLLVTVPEELTDSQVIALRRQTLGAVRSTGARWVVMDFSEVSVCDSYFGRFIHSIAETTRLMGARVVVCGLADSVVETLVDMGFELPGVTTVLDLDMALDLSAEAKAAAQAGDADQRDAEPDGEWNQATTKGED